MIKKGLKIGETWSQMTYHILFNRSTPLIEAPLAEGIEK
jgi:hypothetical protein